MSVHTMSGGDRPCNTECLPSWICSCFACASKAAGSFSSAFSISIFAQRTCVWFYHRLLTWGRLRNFPICGLYDQRMKNHSWGKALYYKPRKNEMLLESPWFNTSRPHANPAVLTLQVPFTQVLMGTGRQFAREIRPPPPLFLDLRFEDRRLFRDCFLFSDLRLEDLRLVLDPPQLLLSAMCPNF